MPMAVFQEKTIPEGASLAGWARLVDELALSAPVRHPICVSPQHVSGSSRRQGDWTIFDKRYWPGDSLTDHLAFAMRHDDLDLLILKCVFQVMTQFQIAAMVRAAPTGIPARRMWYFYEFLTGRTLDVEDASNTAAVDIIDLKDYFTGKPRLSKRHRVRDNLL